MSWTSILLRGLQIRLSRGVFWLRENTGIGSWVVVNEDKTIQGEVAAIQPFHLDGDFTFDLRVRLSEQESVCYERIFGRRLVSISYHCEVMPGERWAGPRLDSLCQSLSTGDQLLVRGRECFDPPHLGYPQELELHPVRGIERVP